MNHTWNKGQTNPRVVWREDEVIGIAINEEESHRFVAAHNNSISALFDCTDRKALILIVEQLKYALDRALEQELGLLTLDHDELGITTKAIEANIKLYSMAIAKTESVVPLIKTSSSPFDNAAQEGFPNPNEVTSD